MISIKLRGVPFNGKVIPIKEHTVSSTIVKNGVESEGPPVKMMEFYSFYWGYVPVPENPGAYKMGVNRSHWVIEKRLYDNFIKNFKLN